MSLVFLVDFILVVACFAPAKTNELHVLNCSTAHALPFPILLNGFTFLILVEMRFAIAYAWELVAIIIMIFPLAYMLAHIRSVQPTGFVAHNLGNFVAQRIWMHQMETYVLMIIWCGSKMIPVVHESHLTFSFHHLQFSIRHSGLIKFAILKCDTQRAYTNCRLLWWNAFLQDEFCGSI